MNRVLQPALKSDEPWLRPWPHDGLESVKKCPVCRESSREVLHENLVDNAFRAAPGKWTLWRCVTCKSAYLDPRPTQSTIHLAYANYYTHQETGEKCDYANLNSFRKMRRQLVNGYTNCQYCTRNVPASEFGILAAFLMPNLKKVLNRQYRYLPRLPKGGGTLLDVGSGDGSFLELARTCGWDVVGVEPDHKAMTNAVRKGLTVHEGGIEYFDGKAGVFDVITLNHVIEHVPDPVQVLKTCYTLLKPGGQLWLETPNIDSFGHARFQENWRGLETPRHLVLFARDALILALINAGFDSHRDETRPSPCVRMYKASEAMSNGRLPHEGGALHGILRMQASAAAFAGMLLRSRREFMTMSAFKTGG